MRRQLHGLHMAILFISFGLAFPQLACKKVSIKPIGEKHDTESGSDINSDIDTTGETETSLETSIQSDTESVTETDTISDTLSAAGDSDTVSDSTVDTHSEMMTDSATASESEETDTDTTTETESDGAGVLVWANSTGSGTTQWGRGIAALPDGSLLLTGTFAGTATFGSQEANETSLTSAGYDDMFVAKYTPDGILLWVKRAGGTSYDASFDIIVFSDGSSLVTGFFEGSATFGPGETNEISLISNGVTDTFVAKYGADGQLVWAKQITSPKIDWGVALAALPDGSAFLTGNFEGTVSMGLGEPGETSLTAQGDMDIFIAKLAPDGTLVWSERLMGTDYDWGSDITALPDNSLLVIGVYEGSAVFGAGKTTETTLHSAGGTDIFIAKFSSEGTFAWAKPAGGTLGDWVGGIAARTDGTFLASGYFEGTSVLGIGENRETRLTATGSRDVFVAEFASDGSLVWAKSAGGSALSRANDIAIAPDGTGIIVGYFEESITFGAEESLETTLISAGEFDVFLAKLATDGTLSWATQAGGERTDKGNDMVLSNGFAIVTGYFTGISIFGAAQYSETTLTASGDEDMFVAKFDI